jgi:hypothetical protein
MCQQILIKLEKQEGLQLYNYITISAIYNVYKNVYKTEQKEIYHKRSIAFNYGL